MALKLILTGNPISRMTLNKAISAPDILSPAAYYDPYPPSRYSSIVLWVVLMARPRYLTALYPPPPLLASRQCQSQRSCQPPRRTQVSRNSSLLLLFTMGHRYAHSNNSEDLDPSTPVQLPGCRTCRHSLYNTMNAPTDTALIRMENAQLVRGETTVFSGLRATVHTSQRLAILGPNGIGKTSLAMVLAGRLRLSRGTLELLGIDVRNTDIRALRPKIGYFSDELITRLSPDMTALEVVALGKFSGLRSEWFKLDDDDHAEANHLLTLVGLANFGRRTLDSLSTGQRQRVMLARAFSGTPRLTVLDEPTSHLDLVAREQMIEALERILDEHHQDGALVMVAHHLEDLPPSITHALLMSESGQWYGSSDDVLTSETLTQAFDHPIEVHNLAGRRIATALRTN